MIFDGDEIKIGLAVENTVGSTGWQVIGDWINKEIEMGKDNLMRVPVDKISSTRAGIKAYKKLLNKINEWIEEKNTLIKEEQKK